MAIRAGEEAQWVKVLATQVQGPELGPQNPYKNLGTGSGLGITVLVLRQAGPRCSLASKPWRVRLVRDCLRKGGGLRSGPLPRPAHRLLTDSHVHCTCAFLGPLGTS